MAGFPTARTIRSAEFLGLSLMAVAVVWWAIVYIQVMGNTGFPIGRTLPCLLYTSDRCSLAMALCKDWHFLGIKRYSAELLWAGAAVSGLALLLSTHAERSRRS
jgi:hypothetical protein